MLFKLANFFYGTALFEQLINTVRFIEMWMFVRVCIRAFVCVSFNQVEVTLHLY